MLSNKRSKVSRHRGSNAHGGGHKKKRRGAGHRGGKGFSGTGARGDQQKPGVIKGARKFLKKLSAKKGIKLTQIDKNYKHFGKKGFTSRSKSTNTILSLSYIESNFDKMVETGMIVKEKNDYVFNADAAGYDKILGRGNFTKKMTIIVGEMSASAQQRVKDVGGKVELLYGDDFEETKEE